MNLYRIIFRTSMKDFYVVAASYQEAISRLQRHHAITREAISGCPSPTYLDDKYPIEPRMVECLYDNILIAENAKQPLKENAQ